MSEDFQGAEESLGRLKAWTMKLQEERGFPEPFSVGDLVRFTFAVHWNRDKDYEIVAIYNNGFEVKMVGDEYNNVFRHTDEDCIRLGMVHSPTGKENEGE